MKTEIIYKALNNLAENLPFTLELIDNVGDYGQLKLIFAKEEFKYDIDIKVDLRSYHINNYISKGKRQFIVIADYISPNVKKLLVEHNIPYIDTNGNIYISKNDCYIYIDNNKKLEKKLDKTNRAFTKTGLKVLFEMLNRQELINLPQREIANQTGVSLGSIPKILKGLKDEHYIIPKDKKTFIWSNREKLLQKWVGEYSTFLRPKLQIAKFTLQNNWKDVTLDTKNTVWGGEAAADILTNYLRAEKILVYTKETTINLMKNYKFRPDEKGEIEVLQMFWNNDVNDKICSPLLIYAELITIGGKRNIETANIIYDKFIKPNL